MVAKTITIKLVKSKSGHTKDIQATVLGLGLRKIGQKMTLENTPAVRGMIKKVIHLVEVAD